MHSRIFQVSTRPIPPDEYLSDCYDDYFLSTIADYVIKSEDDREDDIDCLVGVSGISVAEESPGVLYFTVDKEAYLKPRYEGFKKCLLYMMNHLSFDAFCEAGVADSVSHMMYDLNEAYNDKYASRIINSDDGDIAYTLTDFVYLANEGVKYYIGGILDYHY